MKSGFPFKIHVKFSWPCTGPVWKNKSLKAQTSVANKYIDLAVDKKCAYLLSWYHKLEVHLFLYTLVLVKNSTRGSDTNRLHDLAVFRCVFRSNNDPWERTNFSIFCLICFENNINSCVEGLFVILCEVDVNWKSWVYWLRVLVMWYDYWSLLWENSVCKRQKKELQWKILW